jgi:hypothetical protein
MIASSRSVSSGDRASPLRHAASSRVPAIDSGSLMVACQENIGLIEVNGVPIPSVAPTVAAPDDDLPPGFL